jgi:peptidoglycan-associated lipoprotein
VKSFKIASAMILVIALSACSKPPLEEINAAEAALKAARDARAPDCAPASFKSAEEMMARTFRLNNDKEYGEAKDAAVTTRELAEVARVESRRAIDAGCVATARADGAGSPGSSGDGARLGGSGSFSESDIRQEIASTRTGEGSLGDGALIQGLKPIHFGFDDSALSPEALQIIAQNADWIKLRPSVKVQIEGHTDERGTAEYNLALGERRARSVRDALFRLGVSASQLSVISYGEEAPAAVGQDESAWAENRRAEFVVK